MIYSTLACRGEYLMLSAMVWPCMRPCIGLCCSTNQHCPVTYQLKWDTAEFQPIKIHFMSGQMRHVSTAHRVHCRIQSKYGRHFTKQKTFILSCNICGLLMVDDSRCIIIRGPCRVITLYYTILHPHTRGSGGGRQPGTSGKVLPR